MCCHFLLQGIFPSQGSHPGLLHCRRILYCLSHQGSPCMSLKRRSQNLNLSLSCVCFEHSVAQLCQTLASPWAVACQALLSMGFPRQEYCSGLPFPSPMHESESEVAQSCPTLSDPMDCSLPGSSVHGIFQARVPEWGAGIPKQALNTPSFPFVQVSGEGNGYPLLAWRISWTEDPGRLQSIGLQRVRHD